MTIKKLRLFRFFNGKEAFWDDPSRKILFEDGFSYCREGPMQSSCPDKKTVMGIRLFAQKLEGLEVRLPKEIFSYDHPCLLFDPYTLRPDTHLTIHYARNNTILPYIGPNIKVQELTLKYKDHRVFSRAFAIFEALSGRMDLSGICITIH